MRELICKELKIHLNEEFYLLKALGNDLPGAIIAKPSSVKSEALFGEQYKNSAAEKKEGGAQHFSLAGIQMKFSMLAVDARFTLPSSGALGNYIIKTPSPIYPHVPQNEFVMMQLAKAVGIDVPETKLVPVKAIHGLPKLNLPSEKYAYAVRRFDRVAKIERIHCEDFAQVYGVRSDRKYNATNYDSMARLIFVQFPNAWQQLEELIRRIIFNILIGNTDAHLRNFSVIYSENNVPQLSPAYDLVSTLPYIDNKELALNFAKQKDFYAVSEDTLRYFAKRIGANEEAILEVGRKVVSDACIKWPVLINELELNKFIKSALIQHWKNLHNDFRLTC